MLPRQWLSLNSFLSLSRSRSNRESTAPSATSRGWRRLAWTASTCSSWRLVDTWAASACGLRCGTQFCLFVNPIEGPWLPPTDSSSCAMKNDFFVIEAGTHNFGTFALNGCLFLVFATWSLALMIVRAIACDGQRPCHGHIRGKFCQTVMVDTHVSLSS